MVVLEAKNIDRSAGHHTYLIVLVIDIVNTQDSSETFNNDSAE
jgi:hypothetical protein